jgi:hypothetical protein
VESFDNIFEIPNKTNVTLIKLNVIRALIQIKRPLGWNKTNLDNMIREIVNIELYNGKINKKEVYMRERWKNFTLERESDTSG